MSHIRSICCFPSIFFFFNHTATTEIYTLSLHDALPICLVIGAALPYLIDWTLGSIIPLPLAPALYPGNLALAFAYGLMTALADRKSTRLNSSHQIISYAVFCLKKKINTVL